MKKSPSRIQSMLTSRLGFSFYTFLKVPLLWCSGARVKSLNEEGCTVMVPFRKRNLNPFRSMYFAVEAMGAELSTAVPVLLAIDAYPKRSMAYIVTAFQANFHKKVQEDLIIVCNDAKRVEEEIKLAYDTSEAREIFIKAEGFLKNGEIACSFSVKWSVKRRF